MYNTIRLIKSDLKRKQQIFLEDGSKISLLRACITDGTSANILYRLAFRCSKSKLLAPIALLLQHLNRVYNGCMIGVKAESEATIRNGTSAVLTAAMTNVPWASIMVRRSFGVAQAAHYGPNCFLLAWPSAESGPLPVEGGVAVAFQKEIESAPDPEARRKELEEKFAKKQSPFPRAEAFAVHEIIDPRSTRTELCKWISRIQPLLPTLLGGARFYIRP